MGASENDILNPDPGHDLNPNYGFIVDRNDPMHRFGPRNTRPVTRLVESEGNRFELTWTSRPKAIVDQLLRWQAQYEQGFFVFRDHERDRYYSGNFIAPLKYSDEAYEKWTVQGIFQEYAGVPMFAYPDDWNNHGVFIEETDDFGNVVPATSGIWTYQAAAPAHGGHEIMNAGTNGVDFATFSYLGYGFRLWLRTQGNFGQCEISLDDAVIVPVLDLYTAAVVASKPVVEHPAVPWGLHRVKMRTLGTKNGGSTDFLISCDALQVMR